LASTKKKKKKMKKFKEQCDSSKNSNNQRVYIVQARDTNVQIKITYIRFLAM